MCLVLIDWQPDNDNWLNLVSNRDEFYNRATLPLQPWQNYPYLYAGIDTQHNGTWFGVNKQTKRFAILTNVRAKNSVKDKASRGHLVREALLNENKLTQKNIEESIFKLSANEYSSFNLLVGDINCLFYISNFPELRIKQLKPDIYTLSNASLNTPWPKTLAAKQNYIYWQQHKHKELIKLLTNPKTYPLEVLPDTGVTIELEQQLSAEFIQIEHYGTVSSHSLIGYKNKLTIEEIQWDKKASIKQHTSFELLD